MSKLNCKGVGLVIDDQVPLGEESVSDPIGTIVSQLSADGVPLLRYRELPTKGQFENFHGLAFVLVDWSLLSTDSGEAAKEAMKAAICRFVASFHAECFAPVFVFSNQDESEIKKSLKDAKIEVDSPNAYVLVRSKSKMKELDDQQTPKLFGEINNWIRATPTIGLMTKWGRELLCARDKMFADFYGKSHNWPMLLWNAYKGDGDDPAHGLSELMFDNLRARLHCDFELGETVVHVDDSAIKSVVDVLNLSVMLPNDALSRSQIGCGDMFKISQDGDPEVYELVVSCDCDCIVRDVDPSEIFIQTVRVDSPVLASDKEMKNRVQSIKDKEHGSCSYQLKQNPSSQFLFPMNGKCFCTRFRTLVAKPLPDFVMANRVGRILPPYITNIRQRLALWIQRVGIPKLPDEIFKSSAVR